MTPSAGAVSNGGMRIAARHDKLSALPEHRGHDWPQMSTPHPRDPRGYGARRPFGASDCFEEPAAL